MRKNLILIHLIIASLVAPAFVLVATSGGLYLLGVKGDLTSSPISFTADTPLNFASETLEEDVRDLLKNASIDYEFEYIKNRGDVLQTRPTSRTHIEFVKTDTGFTATWQQPSLQKSMIELHKGHGPSLFKTYQKLVAVALLGSILSGIWMGLASPALRRKTLLFSTAGLVVFVLLALS